MSRIYASLRREMIERAYSRCEPAYGYAARAEVISQKIAALLEARKSEHRKITDPAQIFRVPGSRRHDS
jgi:hypothetical protein